MLFRRNIPLKTFLPFFLLGLGIYCFLKSCTPSSYVNNVPPIPYEEEVLYDDYNGQQVLKMRHIFRKGIVYKYNAKYFDENGKMVSNNFVELIPTGERWEMQPELQDVMQIKFGYTEEEKNWAINNPVNKTYDLANRWTDETYEGIIENTKEVWIHPIRHNQYIFTEVAPFPEVKLPLEEGKSWKAGLGGLGGWGDWDDMDIMSSYKVIGKEIIKPPIGKIECWRIEAEAKFVLGTSTLVYHFHEDLGFVQKEYVNYLGQKLIFKMEEVREQ